MHWGVVDESLTDEEGDGVQKASAGRDKLWVRFRLHLTQHLRPTSGRYTSVPSLPYIHVFDGLLLLEMISRTDCNVHDYPLSTARFSTMEIVLRPRSMS